MSLIFVYIFMMNSNLKSNELTGTVPDSLADLSKLTTL